MNDDNIIVASLMKMLGLKEINIPQEISDNIKGSVIVHKDVMCEQFTTYKLEYKEGE